MPRREAQPKKPAKPKKAGKRDLLVENAKRASRAASELAQRASLAAQKHFDFSEPDPLIKRAKAAHENAHRQVEITQAIEEAEEKIRPTKRGPKLQAPEPFKGTFEEAVELALSKKKPGRGGPK